MRSTASSSGSKRRSTSVPERSRRTASGPLWAALRYRRGLSLVLVTLTAVVTAAMSVAPLFARSLEQGLLRAAVDRLAPADATVTLRAVRATEQAGITDADLAARLPAGAAAHLRPGIGSLTAPTSVATRPGAVRSPVRLVSRTGVCAHLEVTGGCPRAAGEVLVSATDAAAWGWRPGTRLTLADDTRAASVTVVGSYAVVPDEAYWLRTRLDGLSGQAIPVGTELAPGVDALVTDAATFATGWQRAQVSLELPVRTERITLETVPRARAAIEEVRPGVNGVQVTSPLPDLLETVDQGRALVATIVPLLMAQLVLLALVALSTAASAAIEQRRGEIALARLRGRSREAARRVVLGEFGLTVAVGVPVGVVLAFGVDALVRAVVLPEGVPLEPRWPVFAATGLAGMVALAVVALAARPVLREPVAELLRRSAAGGARLQGRGSGVAATEALVVGVALLALVGVVTGQVRGPAGLLVPGLLALGVGVVLTRLLAAPAREGGARLLRRGALARAWAVLTFARRPASRRLLVVVAAASALVVFAVGALVVGERNRDNRARLEAGAPTVLRSDLTDVTQLTRALDTLPERERRLVTPVVVTRARAAGAASTLAVRPTELARVAFAPPVQAPLAHDRVAARGEPPVLLDGRRVTGQLDYRTSRPEPGAEGSGLRASDLLVGVSVTFADGRLLQRDLAVVPGRGRGSVRVDAPLVCSQTCRMHGLWGRLVDPYAAPVTGELRVTGLALDGRPLALTDPSGWQDPQATPERSQRVRRGAGTVPGALTLDVRNDGTLMTTTRADVPDPLPAIVAGQVGGHGEVLGLSGQPLATRAVQRVPALPEVSAPASLVDLDVLSRLGGVLPPTGRLEVWVASTSPEQLSAVRTALDRRGVGIVSARSVSEVRRGYDQSATGWGLTLAVLSALASVLLAGLVVLIVAATGWRADARDLAALRLVGVPAPERRRAALLAQVGPSLAGVAVGAVCGALGLVVALPLLPLSDRPTSVPALDLSLPWGVLAATTVVLAGLLAALGALVARAGTARAVPARLREGA